ELVCVVDGGGCRVVCRENAGAGTEALGDGPGDRGGVAPEGFVDDHSVHGMDLEPQAPTTPASPPAGSVGKGRRALLGRAGRTEPGCETGSDRHVPRGA